MASKKFTTDKQYYKVDKKGNYVLNANGGRIKISVYNGITFDEMVDWLTENGTDEDRAAFKKALYSYKDGTAMPVVVSKAGEEYQKINFINAKREFFKRHNPSYLPKKEAAEPTEKKSAKIANW